MTAPERIWAEITDTDYRGVGVMGEWFYTPNGVGVEYTRADIAPTWRSIDSAPKDGTVILGWWNSECIETITFRGNAWTWSSDGDSWSHGGGPTHWMPLPQPPEDTK